MTAAWLKNLTPTKETCDKTPMERWRNVKPTILYLKVFGCMSYYYIPMNLRNKLQPQAAKGIFVGYSKESRAYRLYDPKSGRISVVRTAKFDESIRGSTLLEAKGTHKENIDNLRYTTLGSRQHEDRGEMFEIHNPRDEERGEEQDETGNREEQDPTENREEQHPTENREEQGPTENREKQDTIDNREKQDEIEGRETQGQQRSNIQRGRRKAEEIREEHNRKRKEEEEELRRQGVRRSRRIEERREQVNNVMKHEDKIHMKIPENYKEATEVSEAGEWLKAMKKELESMKEHQVWKLVPRQKGEKVVKSRWVYTTKNDIHKSPKCKARLVAIGCQQ